jgi:hypothetical protein
VVDHCAVSFQIDFEIRKRSAPILGMRCDRVTRPDKQGTVQAIRCDRIGNGKLPPREDRLYDFETVRNQSTLSNKVLSSIPGAGAMASLKTISDSIRGSARCISENVHRVRPTKGLFLPGHKLRFCFDKFPDPVKPAAIGVSRVPIGGSAASP